MSLQDSYEYYEKSIKYNLNTFKVTSILENSKVGNFGVVNKQYEELFKIKNPLSSELLKYINKEVDKNFWKINRKRKYDISVIVPVNNREKTIIGCMQSILTQDFSSFEVIVIDDGSDDNSYNLVKEIEDDRIKLISLEKASGNSGAPRNVGLDVASGEYIVFVDSDDCIEKGYLKELYNSIHHKGLDLAIASKFLKIQYSKGKRVESIINYKFIPNIKVGGIPTFFINSFVIWDKIYRRKYIQKNNIRFSESKIGADSLFLAKAYYFSKEKIVFYDNQFKYKYFAFAEGSVTKKYRSESNIKEEDKPYRMIFEWLEEDDIPESYKFVQWIRRVLSAAYCLKSGSFNIDSNNMNYIYDNFAEAPFHDILEFLRVNKMKDNIYDVEKMWNLIKSR